MEDTATNNTDKSMLHGVYGAVMMAIQNRVEVAEWWKWSGVKNAFEGKTARIC